VHRLCPFPPLGDSLICVVHSCNLVSGVGILLNKNQDLLTFSAF